MQERLWGEGLGLACLAGQGNGLTLFLRLSATLTETKWDLGSQRDGDEEPRAALSCVKALVFLLGLWLPVDRYCYAPWVSLTPLG